MNTRTPVSAAAVSILLAVGQVSVASAGRIPTSGGFRQDAPAAGVDSIEQADRLSKEADKLYDAGRYAEAIPPIEKALSIVEKVLGPDHPRVAALLGNLAELHVKQGSYQSAEPLYVRALSIAEKAFGPDHPGVASRLNDLAQLYQQLGDVARAEPLVVRAFGIYEKALGPDHPGVARCLSDLAGLYRDQGSYAKAESFLARALGIYERAFGPDHPHYAKCLGNLARLYDDEGAYAKAEPLLLRTLAILEKALGPDHPDVATCLDRMASHYQDQGDYSKAEPLFVRSLAISEGTLVPDHSAVSTSLNNLALLYFDQGAFAKSEPLYLRALSISEKEFGPDHPSVATCLSNLAGLYQRLGAFAKSESLYLRALAILEKALGPDHIQVATCIDAFASLCKDRGSYQQAERLLVRALAIRERTLGSDHIDVAMSVGNLGLLHLTRGNYRTAEPLLERALEMCERTLGPNHNHVATSLNNLALLYRMQGTFAKAEPLYSRALSISERTLGPDHTEVATILRNLAKLYYEQGASRKAEPLLVRALAIREKALGPAHPDVAMLLGDVAAIYVAEGAILRAEPLLVRALAICEESLGPDHPDVAGSLVGLASVFVAEGAFPRAEPLLERALAIREKVFGPDDPNVAACLDELAALYLHQGAYRRAEPLLLRSAAIYEKTLGPDHPDLSYVLHNVSLLYWVLGETSRAIAYQARAGDIREHEVLHNLASGSERSKLLYLAQSSHEQDVAISLHVRGAATSPEARRIAMESIVRRKGRALDVMSEAVAALHRRAAPDDQQLFDELAEARRQLSMFSLQGQSDGTVECYRARLLALETRAEELESQISARRSGLGAVIAPVSLDAVRSRIPKDACLVEFATYRIVDLTKREFGPTRYVVYAAGQSGEIAWADLGETAAIDTAIDAMRAAVRDSSSSVEGELSVAARTLDELVFRPVRRLVGPSRRLLIAPDGALNLVPFDALIDEAGRFAVEGYEISYLSSGRDLLRLESRRPSHGPPVVFANPDFGTVSVDTIGKRGIEVDVSSSQLPAASILSQLYFPPLAATAGEADALKAALPDARVLTGKLVTKAAFMELDAPRILHVATHGFFLTSVFPPTGSSRGVSMEGGLATTPVRQGELALENPLIRSGLALAGANLHKGSEGILTAYEASGINLWGTALVVLSACDTGIGEIRTGDGVYGLRRALVLAGSETQVMSLWPVSDEATRELMVGYYTALATGEGRSAAMRRVRLEMLRNTKRRHPFFWAGFIVSGAWDPIERPVGIP